MSLSRLDPASTAIVVVDIQERLAPAMPETQLAQVLRSGRILLEAAGMFSAPVFATEQYPRGLGPTVDAIAEPLEALQVQPIEKLSFSACEAPGFSEAFEAAAPRAAVVIGMESHVCVYQTVRDLTARGVDVHLPIDGVSSRRDDHRDAGIDLCVRAGAVRTTTETIAFDWLQVAGTDEGIEPRTSEHEGHDVARCGQPFHPHPLDRQRS